MYLLICILCLVSYFIFYLIILFLVSLCSFFVIFFFFSSRRRHTRYIGDWSSDVCSSDLGPERALILSQHSSWEGETRSCGERINARSGPFSSPRAALRWRSPDGSPSRSRRACRRQSRGFRPCS